MDPLLGVVITVDVVVGVLVHRAEEEEDERVDKKTDGRAATGPRRRQKAAEIPHLQHDSPHIATTA